jgi:hypothetical protein
MRNASLTAYSKRPVIDEPKTVTLDNLAREPARHRAYDQ